MFVRVLTGLNFFSFMYKSMYVSNNLLMLAVEVVFQDLNFITNLYIFFYLWIGKGKWIKLKKIQSTVELLF